LVNIRTSEYLDRKDRKEILGLTQQKSKKTFSERNILSSLGKGPIFEKLKSKTRESIEESKLEGNENSEHYLLELKKSIISNIQIEDKKLRDSFFRPKEAISSAKHSEKDLKKSIKASVELKEKSYLEDKTEMVQFLNVSVTGIQKQESSSFKIELNKMTDSKKEDDVEKILAKIKSTLIESVSNPKKEQQPIIYSKQLNKIYGFCASTFQNWK
jgi:hypothetical protein